MLKLSELILATVWDVMAQEWVGTSGLPRLSTKYMNKELLPPLIVEVSWLDTMRQTLYLIKT